MLRTIEQGTGRGVLLIHGNGPDGSSWQGVVDDLGRDHHVVAYDRRGYDGDAPAADWNVHISDAIEMIETHSLAPAIVAASSAGCIIAAGVAVQRPDLVSRLVLFDPIIRGQKQPTLKLIRTVIGVQLQRRRDPAAAAERFFRWATSYNDGPGSAFDSMPADRRAEMRGRHATVFAEMDAGDGTKELPRDRLRELEDVTIAIGSRTDRWFEKTSRALAKAIPSARVVSVEGAGHAVGLDAPRAAAEIIRSA